MQSIQNRLDRFWSAEDARKDRWTRRTRDHWWQLRSACRNLDKFLDVLGHLCCADNPELTAAFKDLIPELSTLQGRCGELPVLAPDLIPERPSDPSRDRRVRLRLPSIPRIPIPELTPGAQVAVGAGVGLIVVCALCPSCCFGMIAILL